jgi:hypothetical protein
LQMGREPPVMQGHIVVLLFVHLLVEDILFGYTQSSTRTALVNLGGSTSRFNSRLQAPIAPSRCSDICAFLILLMSALGLKFCQLGYRCWSPERDSRGSNPYLHDLCRWDSSRGRHDTVGDQWMDRVAMRYQY